MRHLHMIACLLAIALGILSGSCGLGQANEAEDTKPRDEHGNTIDVSGMFLFTVSGESSHSFCIHYFDEQNEHRTHYVKSSYRFFFEDGLPETNEPFQIVIGYGPDGKSQEILQRLGKPEALDCQCPPEVSNEPSNDPESQLDRMSQD